MTLLDNVTQAARDKYENPQDIGDLLAAATLAKTIAEANKVEVEAVNHLEQFRLERLKSRSTLLIPLVSLLTLMGTVIFQWVQLRQQTISAYSQSEDAEWRDMVLSLRQSSDYANDITVPSRLQPFLDSEKYKERAQNLAVRLMGNLTNVNAFVELYNSTIKDKKDELRRNAGIARALTAVRLSLESACMLEANELGIAEPYGVCTVALAYNAALAMINQAKAPAVAFQRRQAYLAVQAEILFVSPRIAALLPRVGLGDSLQTAKSDGLIEIDLSFLTIGNSDLSHVDFSSVDLSGTLLAYNKLDGAKCTPKKWDYSFDIADSEWWNCQSINQQILALAIEHRFPFSNPGQFAYPSGSPTRELYEARVQTLCTSKMDICKPPLKYGSPRQFPANAPTQN